MAALSVAGDVYHDDSWKSHLEATFGMDKSQTYRDDIPGFQASEFDTYRYGLLGSTTKTFDTGPIFHTLVVGGEIYREQVRSTVDFDQDSRDLLAGYVQYQADSGPWTLALAGRVDHNSQFGTAPTYNVGLGYRATDWLKLRASYGTGFRTPTFNDLYYPGFSNPDLDPEHSQTFEVGATFTPWTGTSLDIAAYRTRIEDMIAYDPARRNVYNINEAEITGVEVAISHQLTDQWTVSGSADFINAIDVASGNQLRYRPHLKATGAVSYTPTEDLTLTGTVSYLGERYSDTANTKELPGVVTVGASLEYKVDDLSTLRASVDNIFDQEYSSVEGYRAPGRTFQVSFSRKF